MISASNNSPSVSNDHPPGIRPRPKVPLFLLAVGLEMPFAANIKEIPIKNMYANFMDKKPNDVSIQEDFGDLLNEKKIS